MNEPKRRGRPAKAREVPELSEARHAFHSGMAGGAFSVEAACLSAAQAYALRVWNGQSRDVPRNERLRRVKAALEGQGLSMEGVEL